MCLNLCLVLLHCCSALFSIAVEGMMCLLSQLKLHGAICQGLSQNSDCTCSVNMLSCSWTLWEFFATDCVAALHASMQPWARQQSSAWSLSLVQVQHYLSLHALHCLERWLGDWTVGRESGPDSDKLQCMTCIDWICWKLCAGLAQSLRWQWSGKELWQGMSTPEEGWWVAQRLVWPLHQRRNNNSRWWFIRHQTCCGTMVMQLSELWSSGPQQAGQECSLASRWAQLGMVLNEPDMTSMMCVTSYFMTPSTSSSLIKIPEHTKA